MNHEADRSAANQTHLHQGADGADHLAAAFNHLRGFLSERGGTPWSVSHPDQENSIRQWAVAVGRLLTLEAIPGLRRRGGQEHDLLDPVREGRLWKVTTSGYFGLTPGLELDLVPAGVDGRRFHLWESGVYWYLERLVLQNELFGPINRLEGLLKEGDQLVVVTSQPLYELHRISQHEIDEWFITQGFARIIDAGYYRLADNIAVFDAHEKNVTRSEGLIIPFDVIPCRPDGGFLEFIEKTLQAGESLRAVRTTRTTESPIDA